MSLVRSTIVAGALSAAVASAANAALMTFTYSGVASGSWVSGIYTGQTFTGKAFTITGMAITEQRSSDGAGLYGGYSMQHGITQLTIAGLPQMAVTTSMFTQTDPEGGVVLVSGSIRGAYVFETSGPSGWNMLTSLPAAPYSVGYPSAGIPTILTTLGGFQFTSFSGPVTFGAQLAPAPGAAALIGLFGAFGARRRRA